MGAFHEAGEGSVAEHPFNLWALYRAPLVGLLAFTAVLLANPVAHSARVAIRDLLLAGGAGALNLAIDLVIDTANGTSIQDSDTGMEQFSQELRFASSWAGPIRLMVGGSTGAKMRCENRAP